MLSILDLGLSKEPAKEIKRPIYIKRDLYTSKGPCKRDFDTWKEAYVVYIRSRSVERARKRDLDP